MALLDAAIGHGAVGEYQLQAAIAAVHDRARRAEGTTGVRSLPCEVDLRQARPAGCLLQLR